MGANCVGNSFAIGVYLILYAIYESGGSAITVTDDEMIEFIKKTINWLIEENYISLSKI